MLRLLHRGIRSSTPRTIRRSAARRRQRTNLGFLELLEGRTVPSTITLAGSSGINSAQVVFDQPGGTGTPLTVTLTNTSPHVFDNTDKLTPTNALTGVLFDAAGSTLTPGNANLASGSHMVNNESTDISANGWGFGTPTGGTFNGQQYGIEAFGGITPGHSNFANSNGSALDGVDYGIVGSGYVPGTGNGQLPTTPLEQTAEEFHFTVPSTFDVSQILNVSFQYGTSNGEAAFPPSKASPKITTTPDPSSVTLSNTGSPTLKDSATLSGGYNETGTITFTLYAPDGTTVVDTEQATVHGDGTYSTPTGFTLPSDGSTVTGTYQWVASYSGDGNNNPIASNKGDESVVVSPASPTLVTTASPSGTITLGSTAQTLKDSAALSGGYNPTGTITFTLTDPNGNTVDTEMATVSGNGTYSTPTGYTLSINQAVPGTYKWTARYGGDGNNNTASDNGSSATEQVAVMLKAQIAETIYSASDFASGISQTLSAINYPNNGGKIGQGINPGQFYYFSFATAKAGDTIIVDETPPTTYQHPFLISGTQTGNVALYNANGSQVVASGTDLGNGDVSFKAPSTGTFVVKVKYDPKSIVGQPVPSNPATVTYAFDTLDGTSDQAHTTVNLQPV